MAAAYVNSNSAHWFSGSGTSEAATLTGVTAGNLLIVAVIWGAGTGASISSIAGNSNTYTLASAGTDGTTGACSIYYVKSATAGSTTVTVQWGADPAAGIIVIHEVSGCDTTAPLDQVLIHPAANPGTGTDAYTSTAVTTTANGEYLFGITFDEGFSGGTFTKGTGYTSIRVQDTSLGTATEDLVQTTAGSIAATFTISANSFNRAITSIATFKAASAGGGGRGLFRTPPLSGIGVGASFFRDPLQGAAA